MLHCFSKETVQKFSFISHKLITYAIIDLNIDEKGS